MDRLKYSILLRLGILLIVIGIAMGGLIGIEFMYKWILRHLF